MSGTLDYCWCSKKNNGNVHFFDYDLCDKPGRWAWAVEHSEKGVKPALSIPILIDIRFYWLDPLSYCPYNKLREAA